MVVILPFQSPGGLTVARPVADVHIEGLREAPLRCLLDTGSVHSLFDGWVARACGVDLSSAAPRELGLGGRAVTARFETVRMYLGRHTWEAEVGFCDDWRWDHQVLGLHGFFRWFDVTISGAAQTTTLVPVLD